MGEVGDTVPEDGVAASEAEIAVALNAAASTVADRAATPR